MNLLIFIGLTISGTLTLTNTNQRYHYYALKNSNAIIINSSFLNADVNSISLSDNRVFGVKINYFENQILNYNIYYDSNSNLNENIYNEYRYQCDLLMKLNNTYFNHFDSISGLYLSEYEIAIGFLPITKKFDENGNIINNPLFENQKYIDIFSQISISLSMSGVTTLDDLSSNYENISNTQTMVFENPLNLNILHEKISVSRQSEAENTISNCISIIQFSIINDNYEKGYQNGFSVGKNDGYQEGFNDGLSQQTVHQNDITSFFRSIFGIVDDVLNIEILPNFKLWYVLGIPLLFGAVIFVIRLFI